jgi:hypothetical protein
VTDVSLDVYWPRDFVGRTLTSHPLEARGDVLWCRTCGVEVESSGLHLMVQLLDGVKAEPSERWVEPDRRESSIGFEDRL